jgi:hypothetical protein
MRSPSLRSIRLRPFRPLLRDAEQSRGVRDGEQSRTVEGKLCEARRGGLFLVEDEQKQIPLLHAGG